MANLKSRVQKARQETLNKRNLIESKRHEQLKQEAIGFERGLSSRVEEFESLVYKQLIDKPYARINVLEVFNNGELVLSQMKQDKLDMFIERLLKELGLVEIGRYENTIDYQNILVVALKRDRRKAQREYVKHEKQSRNERYPQLWYQKSISWEDLSLYIVLGISILFAILIDLTNH